jgi:RNA polymerase sigma-70 factor, ECF subfamily
MVRGDPNRRRPGAAPPPKPEHTDSSSTPGPQEPTVSTPQSDRTGADDSALEGDGLEPDELENCTQPEEEFGVRGDMATVALDRMGFEQSRRENSPVGSPATAVSGWKDLSDAEIMLRVREGDDSGFDLLIEKYRRPIVHFMFRMVHNQAVAEELAQEVFLRVYRSRASYRAEAKFSTWLYRIATNLGVNYARDTRHERNAHAVYLDQPDPETGTTPDVADSTPTIEQDLLREERLRSIRQHVLALPERQRTAVLMHKYQDLDYKEIGAVLKLSESATKSLLFRAYQTLRESLKEFA